MMKMLVSLVSVCCLSSCTMLSSVHTAKTLGAGVGSFSMSMDGAVVNTAHGTGDDPHADDTVETYPNASILPNLQFQMGVTDNVEIGGFIVPLMIGCELNVKYRYLSSNGNHFAIIPNASYYLLYNYAGGIQHVYTKDLSDNFSLSVGALTNYTYFDRKDIGGADENDFGMTKHYMTVGGYLAPCISGDALYFTPSVEYSSFLPLGDETYFNNMQTFRFRATLGIYIGKTKKQLDRIESKIDRIEGKLDKK